MSFRTPVDIANRGLQHLGQTRISETDGFTEDSGRASAMAFAYDKLRRPELRANYWQFATRRVVLRPVDTTTMIIAPPLWASTTTYRPGAIVTDEGNALWVSNYPDNINNTPGNSYFWEVYTGPLTANPYDSTIAYFAGEIVYTFDGDGTYQVFVSLENSNDEDPNVGTDWDDETVYMRDQVVDYLGTPFISLIDLNMANTPSATPNPWSSGTTYSIGQQVYGSVADPTIYTSLQNSNTGHTPASSPTFWTNTGVFQPWADTISGGTGSKKWLELTPIALTDFFMIYPIGTGPSSNAVTKNIYRLPAGFVRKAPLDPKAGSTSPLGAPSGLAYDDWLIENDFIVTTEARAIVLRFIADIQDVTKMDDMFCEGLAARMALETCEELTQSTGKKQAVASEYNKFINIAKKTNAIETGPIEPPEDDFLQCRV